MGPQDTLFDLFCSRMEALAAEKGLTTEEKDRIVDVFRKALANPYLDDQQIYRKLTGEEPV